MKKSKYLFMTAVLTAAMLSSACTLIYDSESSDMSDDTPSGNSKPVSDDYEESSFDIGQVSKPVSSGMEENSDKSEPDSDPESSDINSSTSSYEYEFAAPNEEEAVEVTENNLVYDFAYIRYAQPIFYSTLDNPELINTDKLYDLYTVIENTDYLRVKAGDKLENGLTVKSAGCVFSRSGNLNNSKLEFDGELTLEGILYCHPEDDYNIDVGQLSFWADAGKSDLVPLPRAEDFSDIPDRTELFIDTDNEFAVVNDGGKITVGNFYDAQIDLSGIIYPGECIKAQITVSDLRKGWSEFNGFVSNAKLISVEKLPD